MNRDRIEYLKQFIADEPGNPFNYYALAMEYHDYLPEKALALFERLLDRHPDYLPTYFKAAHLYRDMENREKANDVFKKGIALAEQKNESKALSELKSTYQNFLIEAE